MTTNRNMKTRSIIIFFLFGAAFFVACNSEQAFAPTAPGSSQLTILSKSGSGSGGNGNPGAYSALLYVKKREEAEEGVSTAVIGPAGGTLFHAAHRIVVPPGALSAPVQLSFTMPASDTLMFEFGPDGIQFNAPIQVILNYDHAYNSGLDQELYEVVFWNTTTRSWENVPTTVNTETNEVAGNTQHFSRYAISKG